MDRKGGSYRIMLQQFPTSYCSNSRKRTQSTYILQLHHYVRGTEQEASRDASDLIIVTTDGDHTSVEVIVGFHLHISEGYAMCKQFHNG